MPHLLAPCVALGVVALSPFAGCALDRALLIAPLPQPLAGALHG